jgi:hypothetical protein
MLVISKLNINSVMVNCLTGSEIIKGKNDKAVFSNEWRKVDDAKDCSWCEMAKFCRVKGGY